LQLQFPSVTGAAVQERLVPGTIFTCLPFHVSWQFLLQAAIDPGTKKKKNRLMVPVCDFWKRLLLYRVRLTYKTI
jgi:hypothetical protein